MFKVADDNGLALLDLKDLGAMLQYVGDNASDVTTDYGTISAASVGAIQRGLAQIEAEGGAQFFGESMLNIADFRQTDGGHGVINILNIRGRRQTHDRAAAVRDVPVVAVVGVVGSPA